MKLSLTPVALVLAAACASAQSVQIDNPQHDTIVLEEKVTIKGTAGLASCDANRKVAVRLRKESYEHNPVRVEAAQQMADLDDQGKWEIEVTVPVGTTLVTATRNGQSAHVLVTRARDIMRRPRQKVGLRWEAGAVEKLVAIVQDTLDGALLHEEEARVRQVAPPRVRELVLAAYDGLDVEAIDRDEAGMHTILFVDRNVEGGGFGSTPECDCGNQHPGETSQVSVRNLHRSMTLEFFKWGPMQRGDQVEDRIEDLAQALARTAAHELGHGLGLVGAPGDSCAWMLGCPGNHNCRAFGFKYPMLLPRHKSGECIMDEGNEAYYNMRLGEPNHRERTVPRRPASFSPFNRAYLQLVHGK